MDLNQASKFLRSLLIGLCSLVGVASADPPRVVEPGKLPADSRLAAPRTYNDAFHPWTPPTTRAAWEKQRQELRERMLVGQGLWPMPPRAPLAPVVHGKIDKGDYTIEKVYFASVPGHYVSGNLYRPKNLQGKAPGVLFAHGHWENGRMYELAADKAQKDEIDKGAEKFMAGARYLLQAPAVGLARMGCVAFEYDMIGYADSKPVIHRQGFTDLEASLRLQDFMGLQTINSMQALDFLTSLPDVDPARIGVTGASGGGTQTFVLGALDPRPAAIFPAVMVGTAMQGGCVCENCAYMRIGINNIALAGIFAPKPMAMSGANDWTREIETKGLPELKQIYGLYGVPDNVYAKAYPQFGHNYNQVAREMMYAWFNRHLKAGQPEPIVERDFVPVPPADLSVFDAEHRRPDDAQDAAGLKRWMTRVSDEQFAALVPRDTSGLAEFRRIVGTAARVMLDGGVPAADDVVAASPLLDSEGEGYRLFRISASRRGAGEQIPIVALLPPNFSGNTVLWFDGAGKKHLFDAAGQPVAAVRKLLTAGMGVISADLFQTGEFLADESKGPPAPVVNENFPAYTFCYNRPLIAQRVHDIMTILGGLKRFGNFTTLHLVGTGEAGTWVLLARAVAGEGIERCLVDLRGFGYAKVTAVNDPRMLPGGRKYGGIGGLAALAAPGELVICGTRDAPSEEFAALKQVYKVAGGKLDLLDEPLTADAVVGRLIK